MTPQESAHETSPSHYVLATLIWQLSDVGHQVATGESWNAVVQPRPDGGWEAALILRGEARVWPDTQTPGAVGCPLQGMGTPVPHRRSGPPALDRLLGARIPCRPRARLLGHQVGGVAPQLGDRAWGERSEDRGYSAGAGPRAGLRSKHSPRQRWILGVAERAGQPSREPSREPSKIPYRNAYWAQIPGLLTAKPP